MLWETYITPISFPRDLKEFAGMLAKNRSGKHPAFVTAIELLASGFTDWSLPRSVKPGDMVFWRMDEDADKRVAAVLKELEAGGFERIPEYLKKGLSERYLRRKLLETAPYFERYAGTLFAVGIAVERPDFEAVPYPRHFEDVFYGFVWNVKLFEEGPTVKALREAGIKTEQIESAERVRSAEDVTKLLAFVLGRRPREPKNRG